MHTDTTAVLEKCFTSEREGGARGPVNLVDVLGGVCREMSDVASAIAPGGTVETEEGGSAASLVEAALQISTALNNVAGALDGIADVLRDRG